MKWAKQISKYLEADGTSMRKIGRVLYFAKDASVKNSLELGALVTFRPEFLTH